ncbi:MAG: peroxiredoxin [Methylotenera sp.]|uniref:peroxiredoxin n=1 Tax=Methylotenera sp. TaxID=2051956 RepID=UPI002487C491|nr:peroxiredoxin [Methylotenera sp.]MDI1309039.1 peroxiredoxin [Methylotenera sp.]
MSINLNTLPQGLPIPLDDGLAAHLEGLYLPEISLASTSGNNVDLKAISGRLVVYIYPLTGRPDVPLPDGWDEIPGARGCTPQACDFSDHFLELQQLNTMVFGLSSQTSEYQLELKNRLHLPFDLLSDHAFQLKSHLNLPVFNVGDLLLYKRLTMIVENSLIKKVFYPVFPPNQNGLQVVNWLKSN